MAETFTPLTLIARAQGFFARKAVDAPRLTAEILLAHALGCDRVRLYLDFDKPVGQSELDLYRDLVRRRSLGEPTAYLVGHRDFYGRTFLVDRRVLVPRPETELVAESALQALPDLGSVLDLGTGSGVLAITLALARPHARVLATDLSDEALEVARDNALRLGASVEFCQGDTYSGIREDLAFDVLVANPPYVPSGELGHLSAEVHYEPVLALDGGKDGLDVLRRVVEGAPRHLNPGGCLVVEMHETHVELVPALCREAGFHEAEAKKDLAGLPRYTVARMAPLHRGS